MNLFHWKKPDNSPHPMARFTASDDAARMDEISMAIEALNAQIIKLGPSKEFSDQFLALIAKAQSASQSKAWDEAHRTIWEATFLVNRAIESEATTELRFWLALSPILSFLVLIVFEWLMNVLLKYHVVGSVLLSTYFPYLWTGAIGGTTIVYWGLIQHTIALDFDDQYKYWYVLKPILGAITGVMTVIVLKAGLFTFQGSANVTTQGELALYIFAFLAGFSERFFIQLVDRVLTALFSGSTPSDTKSPAVSPGTTIINPRRQKDST
jgi:hypothetical protein